MTEQSLDPAARKATLRLITYGLYAVGVAAGQERNLFTANWLSQVSFDPPLLAVSVENDGYSIDLLRRNGVFSVSVLGEDSTDEAALLGKRHALRPNKIDEVRWHAGVTGCPVLDDALGAIECRVVNSMPAGDSTLFMGEVIAARILRQGEPLTMRAAGYRHAG